jgi:deoxyribodipyrimidine photo-lyase
MTTPPDNHPYFRDARASIVWFKRDLRVQDHAPLMQASHASAAAGLYIIEPEWLDSAECDARHVAFVLASLRELSANLQSMGLPLLIRYGSAVDVLAQLHAEHGFERLLSHEETGSGWTYARDMAVAHWCAESGIVWHETPQTGVVRRLRSRNGWAGAWAQRMNAPQVQRSTPPCFTALGGLAADVVPDLAALGFDGLDEALLASPALTVAAGETAAWQVLNSFLNGRGAGYRRALSSPLSAERACSRLSAHLAYGTVSMRTVHQATEAAIVGYQSQQDLAMAGALRGFSGRLRWHCHFMQKLESEPAIEWRNFWRAADGLRPSPLDAEGQRRFDAWCDGNTGYPMIDACMRYLRHTGWLNFRMRAMLVSFASYHLWLDWRITGVFLARQFVDFEPGIHWPQMQMQSGTTGINTLRIYSPTKQGRDQDPQGVFIRRWCPELALVPLAHLHEPWSMNQADQTQAQCRIGSDYPAPIVDEKAALTFARERLYGLRKSATAQGQTQQIMAKHGSRKSGLKQTQRKPIARKTVAKARTAADSASLDVALEQQISLF